MTYYVMIIYLAGYPIAALPFHDGQACGDALPALRTALAASHDEIDLICKDSGMPRVRPIARPDRGMPA